MWQVYPLLHWFYFKKHTTRSTFCVISQDWDRGGYSTSSFRGWVKFQKWSFPIKKVMNKHKFSSFLFRWILYIISDILPPLLWASSWPCHGMMTFSILLALCEGNPPVTGGFPSQRAVMWSLYVFFILASISDKQSVEWLGIGDTMTFVWHHCNVT